MNKRNYILFGIVILCLGSFYFYNNVLYKDSRNIESEESAFKMASSDLIDEFKTDPEKATAKYQDKTIEINGKITEVTDSTAVLDTSIFCAFDKKVAKNNLDQNKTIKGRCIGFDEMFNEVKLDQCTFTK